MNTGFEVSNSRQELFGDNGRWKNIIKIRVTRQAMYV